jgi:5-hydroxyisourate hydrolase-like protein (transthyretin family)
MAFAEGVGSISGVVRSTSGAPIGGITVSSHRVESGEWTEVPAVTTAADGSYTIPGLEPGDYRLVFSSPDGMWVTQGFDGFNTSDLVLDDRFTPVLVDTSPVTGIDAVLYRSSSISGRVTGPKTEAGLQAIQVTAFKRTPEGWYDWRASVRVGEDGRFLVGMLDPGVYRLSFEDTTGNYAGQSYRGVAGSDVHIPSCTNIVVAEGVDIAGKNAKLAKAAWLSGKVLSPAGEPIAGIMVTATRKSSYGWTWGNSAITNASGRYSIGGLAGGTYSVAFYDESGTWGSQMYRNVPTTSYSDRRCTRVTLKAGARRSLSSVKLTRAAAISGSVLSTGAPAPGVTVVFWRKAGSKWYFATACQSDDAGLYRTTSLPSGTYRIEFIRMEQRSIFYGSPDATSERDDRCTNVTVAPGESTTLAAVSLTP